MTLKQTLSSFDALLSMAMSGVTDTLWQSTLDTDSGAIMGRGALRVAEIVLCVGYK